MSELINFYKQIPKHLVNQCQHDNPCYAKTNISLPALMIVAARTGAGKTNWMLNFLHLCQNTFTRVILCTKMPDEVLYKHLISKVPASQMQVLDDLDSLPAVTDKQFSMQEPTLLIVDDMVSELAGKKGKGLCDFFVMGRKKGITTMLLTQDMFKVPTLIRRNLTYVALLQMSSLRSLNVVLSDYALGVTKRELLDMYKYCTKETFDALVIDISKDRFMFNFTPLE